ncbi:carbohydrate porin [Lichenicoccus sp.]|uniref:carbohydrate porin n=1 Tax=Lichenicoccus sp. TaxID=2781899 RepID=UPI003D0F4CE2
MRSTTTALVIAGLLATVSSIAVRAADPPSDGLSQLAITPTASLAQATIPAQPNGTAISPGAGSGTSDSVSGISRNPANNTSGSVFLHGLSQPNSVAVPTSGLFPEFGVSLLDDGIDLHGIAFDRFLGNPTAGIVPGNDYNLGVLSPAADFDLQRILGIHGAAVHVDVTFFGLRSNIPTIATETGGFLTGVQTTPAPSTTPFAVSIFTYDQKLLNDKLSIEVGRTNPFRYFALPNSLDPATYFSSVLEVNGDLASPRFPTWGGLVSYRFTPLWAVQGGAFGDNFYRDEYNPQDLGEVRASGVQTFASLEYRSEFTNAAYPANAELGLEWNTRHGPSNVEGAPIYYNGRNAATDYHGGGVIFMQGEKVIWRGARGRQGPPPNIAIYGQLDAAVDKPVPFDFDTLAGVNFTGLIPGRPFDALGAQVHYQRMSALEANFETRLRNIFAGPGPRQPRDGYGFELIANIHVLPWLQFRPFAEAFINPDSYYDAAQKYRARNGFEFGFLGVIPIGQLLGTSTKPY